MSTVPTLPLDYVVDVTVQVNPQAVQPPKFNQQLIIGNSTAIPSYGTSPRCRLYQGGISILQAMLADGFLVTSPEYLGASFYLQQQPTPFYLWIGRQDGTAIGTIQVNSTNGGINYKVGDQVTVVQTGASHAVLQIMTVDGTGKVTSVQPISQGTGYTVAAGLATTGGSGTGLQVDILTLGESALQAVQACRIASPFWYLFTVLNSSDADNTAISEWAQTASPVCQNFFVTTAPAVLVGTAGNIFDTLMKGNYNRYIGTYITTQTGTAPNNTYFACALMGVAAGRNTGLSGSYFILPFKNVVGMTVESLTPSQYSNITNKNGNAYISYANTYNSLSPGITGSGQYFDQILGIDMLVSDLQYDMTNTLYQYPAVPQTDEGQSILLHSANGSCGKSVNRGFLSSGVWQGQTILNLQSGMSIPGYLNQSPSYASLGAKPANRQAAPIYCAVILSEAVQSVLIAIYVQQ
jgi:hypothetical protein